MMDQAHDPMSILAQVIIALIAAAPPTLLALAAFLASLRNGYKADTAKEEAAAAKMEAARTSEKVGQAIEKIDDNTVKTEQVVKQTNGLADHLMAKIVLLEAETARLKDGR